MNLVPVRKRLLLLGLLGVLMTLSVAGAALVCLSHISAINRELAQVNRALHFHQDADMMHDALHADVARAELAASGRPGLSAASIRRDAEAHAAKFREDLEAIEPLRLPAPLRTALSELRPAQETYIETAESMVDGALARRRVAPVAQATYEVAYRNLVPPQAEVTARLVATSDRVERAAIAEKEEAIRMIAFATAASLAGWLALVAWHHRSLRRLRGALLREAEQRSAADVLQRSLLPTQLPQVPGVQLAARSIPGDSAQRVGGDWYDVIRLPTGEICLVVGDVVGHDLPAASVMGQLRNALRAYALENPSPTSVLGRVNHAAYHLGASDLATCICAVLEPTTMKVSWASAGHLPPLLTSASGTGRLLNGEPGPPLGVTASATYDQHETQLQPDETLLLYSDGLVERRGTPIDARLSTLQGVTLPRLDPEARCDRLLATLLEDGANHDDDVTLLLLHVTPRTAAGAGAATTASAGV